MGTKFVLFTIVTFLTGNPLLAILMVLVLYYVLDLRYLGVSRSLIHRLRSGSEIRGLKREVLLNPHNAAALNDLGRLLVLSRRYREAVPYLEKAIERFEDSDETNYYLGLALVKTGREKAGEERVLKAVGLNPKFRYGEPFLRLGEHYFQQGHYERALTVLQRFHEIHSSSVEGFYFLGEVYQRLGETEKAKESLQKGLEAFRHSPYYKKREERIWAWRSRVTLSGLSSARRRAS